VILTDDDGTIVLGSRRAENMYGYLPGELIGEPVGSLVPDVLRAAHIRRRAGYARHPTVRPTAARSGWPDGARTAVHSRSGSA